MFATARTYSTELEEVIASIKCSVIFMPLDLADEQMIVLSAEKIKAVLAGQSLDILINSAGVHSQAFGTLALIY